MKYACIVSRSIGCIVLVVIVIVVIVIYMTHLNEVRLHFE